mmetsp:Transcript_23900/g.66932  ORF Transcript_23900/g.66932 Transcript_23900/m.66932 type:complete len:431 (-) Transcript_23900:2048-3340(-)
MNEKVMVSPASAKPSPSLSSKTPCFTRVRESKNGRATISAATALSVLPSGPTADTVARLGFRSRSASSCFTSYVPVHSYESPGSRVGTAQPAASTTSSSSSAILTDVRLAVSSLVTLKVYRIWSPTSANELPFVSIHTPTFVRLRPGFRLSSTTSAAESATLTSSSPARAVTDAEFARKPESTSAWEIGYVAVQENDKPGATVTPLAAAVHPASSPPASSVSVIARDASVVVPSLVTSKEYSISSNASAAPSMLLSWNVPVLLSDTPAHVSSSVSSVAVSPTAVPASPPVPDTVTVFDTVPRSASAWVIVYDPEHSSIVTPGATGPALHSALVSPTRGSAPASTFSVWVPTFSARIVYKMVSPAPTQPSSFVSDTTASLATTTLALTSSVTISVTFCCTTDADVSRGPKNAVASAVFVTTPASTSACVSL